MKKRSKLEAFNLSEPLMKVSHERCQMPSAPHRPERPIESILLLLLWTTCCDGTMLAERSSELKRRNVTSFGWFIDRKPANAAPSPHPPLRTCPKINTHIYRSVIKLLTTCSLTVGMRRSESQKSPCEPASARARRPEKLLGGSCSTECKGGKQQQQQQQQRDTIKTIEI